MSSPTARRTSPGCSPREVPATSDSWRRSASLPARPAALAASYVETASSVRPYSACSAPREAIIAAVTVSGAATIPRGRILAAWALISGTTSGTSGSSRKAADWSTTAAPRVVTTGAHRAEISAGVRKTATSPGPRPSKASSVRASTSHSCPRTDSMRPAERPEAIRRMSPQTSARWDSIRSRTEPTAPVAPTTASAGAGVDRGAVIGRCLRRRRPRRCRSRGRRPCARRGRPR